MTISNQTYRFYNQSTGYLERLEAAGWRPEYGAVLGALKQYQRPGGGAALDYGCGVGDLTAILARSGYQAVGADISLPFVRSAQSRHPHLPFVALGASPKIPFGADRFWAVTAVNTIEHVATPAETLTELQRVLIPGGLLAMTFPNLVSPLRPLKRFAARRRRLKYGPESGETMSESLELFARNSSLLIQAGLSRQAQFLPREPDFENAERYRFLGYGADYDAVWLCNPLDIAFHLQGLGMNILQLRGIPGAAEGSTMINRLRGILPAAISSPILLVARKTF